METTTTTVGERRPPDLLVLGRLREIVWHAREQAPQGGGSRVAYEEAQQYVAQHGPLRPCDVRRWLAACHQRSLDRAARLRAALSQEEGALVAYTRLADALGTLESETTGGGGEPC